MAMDRNSIHTHTCRAQFCLGQNYTRTMFLHTRKFTKIQELSDQLREMFVQTRSQGVLCFFSVHCTRKRGVQFLHTTSTEVSEPPQQIGGCLVRHHRIAGFLGATGKIQTQSDILSFRAIRATSFCQAISSVQKKNTK